MAKKKTTGTNLPVPQNDLEAASALARIGEIARQVARVEADCNAEVSKLTEAAGAKAAPLKAEGDGLVEALKVYCEANRARLTDGKSKTIVFATGVVSWRLRPASVKLREKVDVIIERIKLLDLGAAFLRTKEEINKDAMLADAEKAKTIAGVTIASDGEDFYVEPLEAEIAEAVS